MTSRQQTTSKLNNCEDCEVCVAVDLLRSLQNVLLYQAMREISALMMVHMQERKIRGLLMSAKMSLTVSIVKLKMKNFSGFGQFSEWKYARTE